METAREVADRAWSALQRDVEQGDPGPLLELMSDGVRWRSPNPTRRSAGSGSGGRSTRPSPSGGGTTCRCGALTLDRVLDPIGGAGSGTVAYEWTVSSENRGLPYRNSLCIFFDVADGRVTGYREYVNEIDPEAIANGAIEPTTS